MYIIKLKRFLYIIKFRSIKLWLWKAISKSRSISATCIFMQFFWDFYYIKSNWKFFCDESKNWNDHPQKQTDLMMCTHPLLHCQFIAGLSPHDIFQYVHLYTNERVPFQWRCFETRTIIYEQGDQGNKIWFRTLSFWGWISSSIGFKGYESELLLFLLL